MFIDKLLVVGDNRLGNGLTDGIDLGCVSTSCDTDADVDAGELVETDDKERLIDLESQDFRLDEGEGLPVNLDMTFTRLHMLLAFWIVSCGCLVRTLQCATAVAIYNVSSFNSSFIGQEGGRKHVPVFFFPKHCTL